MRFRLFDLGLQLLVLLATQALNLAQIHLLRLLLLTGNRRLCKSEGCLRTILQGQGHRDVSVQDHGWPVCFQLHREEQHGLIVLVEFEIEHPRLQPDVGIHLEVGADLEDCLGQFLVGIPRVRKSLLL